ncbi:acyl carrier protein [Nocardia sp. NPDC058058]|uniref:acyl carrier protein n=1 Tax=Nocardia sp. NPDC058058 TaxID=3346317 RepID=UPI0036D842C0
MNTVIEKELVEIVRDDLAVSLPDIDGASRLIDDLGLDSVAFAVAIVAIEERLGVRLTEQELVNCATLSDVASAVAGRRTAASAEQA